MAKICVVDDQELLRESLSETLSREGHEVRAIGDAREAIEIIEASNVELVITDLKMPHMDGRVLPTGA